MDIRELRYILEIAKTGNMTKAAANLFITQPALSKTLKKVEAQIGMPLLFRDGNMMLPTEAGMLLVDQGQKILTQFEELEKNMSTIKSMRLGRVSLGVPPVIAALDFPEIIAKYREHYHDVSVEIHEYGARKLESMVLDGIVDVGISMHPVMSDGLSEIIIAQDQVVCGLNPEHPLAKKPVVTIEDLAPYPINTFPKNYAVYEELIQKFHAKEIYPIIDVTSPTVEFLLKVSRLLNEVCVLPGACLRHYSDENLVIRNFQPTFPWELCVVYKKNSNMSERVRALISYIVQTVYPQM